MPKPLGGALAVLLAALVAALGAVMLYAIDDSLGTGLVPGAVSARRGAALHVLRRTLLLEDWMEHLRVTSPARYRRLLGDQDGEH